MKPVGTPHGKSEVSNVKAVLVAGDSNDVTVAHGTAHGLAIGDVGLGNISVLPPRERILLSSNHGDHFRMCL